MTINNLKLALFDFISMYFDSATVAWGKTNMAKPRLPFITLELGNVHRTIQPEKRFDSDGKLHYYVPSNVILTVNLFTMGNEVDSEGFSYKENSAADEMSGFLNFACSEYAAEWCRKRDIYMRTEGDIQDLTTLTNDVNWEYRAMVQMNIAFTQEYYGYAGESSETPLIDVGYFEKVNIEYDDD